MYCGQTVQDRPVVRIEVHPNLPNGGRIGGDGGSQSLAYICSGRLFDCAVLGVRQDFEIHSIARPRVPISSPLTHLVYPSPCLSYLTCSNSFCCLSARPCRPGYDGNDRSRSYRFVERQKRQDVDTSKSNETFYLPPRPQPSLRPATQSPKHQYMSMTTKR